MLQNIKDKTASKFNDILATSGASLIYVVDTTGSMGLALISIKSMTRITLKSIKSNVDYILLPFNEPGTSLAKKIPYQSVVYRQVITKQ